jgi:hypothetical protein
MEDKIYKREVFDEIIQYLDEDVILVIIGARQVGKTYILFYLEEYLKKKNKVSYYMDLEDSRYLNILDEGVDAFVRHLKEEGFDTDKKIYVLLDEIQYMESPSSFLKLIHDHHKAIKLIVSGSSSFGIKKKFTDSLVGRTVTFEIFPLSFEEFLRFKEYKFVRGVKFTEKKIDELKALLKEYVLFGSYPKIVLTQAREKKERFLQQIIDTYVIKDIRDIGNIKELDKFNKLIEALSSQSGSLLNVAELSNTCRLAKKTVEHYLFILENTYIIRLVKPYHSNLRSELFKTPKIYFFDSGLLQMLQLKTIPGAIIGNVFETAVFSELVKRYGKDQIFYWRTKDKKEIDFILRQKNKILPVEVKYNFARFSKTSINYFLRRYQLEDYKVIGFLGDLSQEQFMYLWEAI